MKSPFREIMKDLEVIKNGILRDIVNSIDPSLDRFMHKEKMFVISAAINSVKWHAAKHSNSKKKK